MGSQQPQVFFVIGPTAVGKTAVAEYLATLLPAEIINMDVGQLYEPLSIGTSKPTVSAMRAVPHHLFDILTTPRSLTVVAYADLVSTTVAQIHARGNHALIVGGSAFYFTSLFFPPRYTGSVGYTLADDNAQALWNQLHAIDPQRASRIQPTDLYRVKRALAIWHTTGVQPSQCEPRFNPLFSSWVIINCVRDRDDLYARINTRVEAMVEEGWIEEVKRIKGTAWEPFVREKNIIGYPELLDYVQGIGTHSLDQVSTLIAQKTRNYAKRQTTFFRRCKRLLEREGQIDSFYELNLTHNDFGLYLKQLLHQLL